MKTLINKLIDLAYSIGDEDMANRLIALLELIENNEEVKPEDVSDAIGKVKVNLGEDE